MKTKEKKKTSFVLSSVLAISLGVAQPIFAAETPPAVITSTVTENPNSSMKLSWETRDLDVTKAIAQVVKKSDAKKFASKHVKTFTSNDIVFKNNRAYSKVSATQLEEGTEYLYRVGDGTDKGWSDKGQFKTASTDEEKEFSFLYLSDTQYSSASTDGKKTEQMLKNATSQFKDSVDFTYLAGDFTDKANNPDQWDTFFNLSQNLFQDTFMVPVIGNHDSASGLYLDNYFPSPESAKENTANESSYVYSFDYGSAHFASLNTEHSSGEKLEEQVEWLKKDMEASDKKWKIVLFHKSIYPGASHITDSDIIRLRTALSPVLDELNVDAVLSGHDHVYSRGFVNGDGSKENAQPVKPTDLSTVYAPDAPLYYTIVSGGLKFYNPKNYSVTTGDPLIPNYDFLDVKSTNVEDAASADGNKITYSEVTVSDEKITFDTYYTTTKTNDNRHLETFSIVKEKEHETWSPDKVYVAGDRVSHDGRVFEAKWWTKGENPLKSGQWDVWKEIKDENPNEIPEWNASDIYVAGDKAYYNGELYEAKWWTRGDNPSKSGQWDVWKKVK
ncbi:carbohydrate-binding protein [Cytobacillus purgationiresistens]|uniref:MPP superfamily phosphohydrolase n=1 Tax=Cytobacillus purgationiresistens TaxID=863449 RepID=A0ABU0AU62_9BACI|nr:carbohydrate-binding protein [Cytobacillus purgationiresistens]MDQ0273560.1 putative MPP superfamily phosphohydrolase [Cytobacillus purgationiresistens]